MNELGFNPLDLLFALGAPLKVVLRANENQITLYVKPIRMRTVLALWGLENINHENIKIERDDVIFAALSDFITRIEINGETVDDLRKLNPLLTFHLFQLCLQMNGLAEPAATLLRQELDKISAQVKSELAHSPFSEYEASKYYAVAQMAYSAYSTGNTVTAPLLIDEPYLLISAAMAVAKGEREYYDELRAQTEARTQQFTSSPVNVQIPTPPPAYPAHPPRHVKGASKEDMIKKMIELAEQVSGIKFKP